MSSLYKSPGVHIESAGDCYIPLTRVETGVTAFLGITEKGPNNEPTRVGSYEQYAKVFGEAEGYMTGAIRGFFDNGGKSAYVLNVAPEGGLDPTPDDFIGQQGNVPRGLQALERIDDVDIVVAPDSHGPVQEVGRLPGGEPRPRRAAGDGRALREDARPLLPARLAARAQHAGGGRLARPLRQLARGVLFPLD